MLPEVSTITITFVSEDRVCWNIDILHTIVRITSFITIIVSSNGSSNITYNLFQVLWGVKSLSINLLIEVGKVPIPCSALHTPFNLRSKLKAFWVLILAWAISSCPFGMICWSSCLPWYFFRKIVINLSFSLALFWALLRRISHIFSR